MEKVLRRLLLALAGSQLLKKFVLNFPLARRVARRFVAGETLSEALDATRQLQADGLLVTLDLLGENVYTEEESERATRDYLRILEALQATGLRCNVSLKLTQLGLDLDSDICFANLTQILDEAAKTETFVRIDMEGSEYTQASLDMFARARSDHDNVGIVLQSYLHRCHQDVRQVNALKGQVRLCKGAYAEPESIAFQDREAVNRSFIESMHLLMDEGTYPAIASHDEAMIAATLDYVKERQIANDRFEFQMLYGIRRERQLELARQGYNVRIYVPYGREWYPYFMRRLAERPANMIFFLTALFRG